MSKEAELAPFYSKQRSDDNQKPSITPCEESLAPSGAVSFAAQRKEASHTLCNSVSTTFLNFHVAGAHVLCNCRMRGGGGNRSCQKLQRCARRVQTEHNTICSGALALPRHCRGRAVLAVVFTCLTGCDFQGEVVAGLCYGAGGAHAEEKLPGTP